MNAIIIALLGIYLVFVAHGVPLGKVNDVRKISTRLGMASVLLISLVFLKWRNLEHLIAFVEIDSFQWIFAHLNRKTLGLNEFKNWGWG